jgi:hypothetical protein
MPDRIRRVLNDLVLLSQTLSGSERERILETIDRFRHCVEEDDNLISLYEKLSSENNSLPWRSKPRPVWKS